MIRPLLKRTGLWALGRSLERALLREAERPDRLVVLNLHRVDPAPNPFWPPLDPTRFEAMLHFVRERFDVIQFRDLERRSRRPRLILSFDDGCRDFVEVALPILSKLDLPSNLNIVTKVVRDATPLWNIELYDFLQAAPTSTLRQIAIPGFSNALPALPAPHDLTRFGIRLSKHLKQRPRRDREKILATLRPLMDAVEFRHTPMMSAEDVRAAARAGVEIGCHSDTHESMGWETLEYFRGDFERARRLFDDLALPLEIYAFPNGSHRPDHLEELERQGVKHVLLVGESYGHPATREKYRFTVHGASAAELEWIALGGSAWSSRNLPYTLSDALGRRAA